MFFDEEYFGNINNTSEINCVTRREYNLNNTSAEQMDAVQVDINIQDNNLNDSTNTQNPDVDIAFTQEVKININDESKILFGENSDCDDDSEKSENKSFYGDSDKSCGSLNSSNILNSVCNESTLPSNGYEKVLPYNNTLNVNNE